MAVKLQEYFEARNLAKPKSRDYRPMGGSTVYPSAVEDEWII